MEEQKYMRRKEAAEYLHDKYGIGTVATLAKLASIGGGPVFQKYSRFPVYTRECLDKWAKQRLSPFVKSTSDLEAA